MYWLLLNLEHFRMLFCGCRVYMYIHLYAYTCIIPNSTTCNTNIVDYQPNILNKHLTSYLEVML